MGSETNTVGAAAVAERKRVLRILREQAPSLRARHRLAQPVRLDGARAGRPEK